MNAGLGLQQSFKISINTFPIHENKQVIEEQTSLGNFHLPAARLEVEKKWEWNVGGTVACNARSNTSRSGP